MLDDKNKNNDLKISLLKFYIVLVSKKHNYHNYP